jgi:hypothetical protein
MVGTELYQVGFGFDYGSPSIIFSGLYAWLSQQMDPPAAIEHRIEALIPPMWKRGMME